MSVSARGVEPQPHELSAAAVRHRRDRVPLLGLGEDGVHDDRVPGREREPRPGVENVIDALRDADAIVLPVEPLRLRYAEEALPLDIAARVQRTGRRAETGGELRRKCRFAGAGKSPDGYQHRLRRIEIGGGERDVALERQPLLLLLLAFELRAARQRHHGAHAGAGGEEQRQAG